MSAIDFQALMLEERKSLRAARAKAAAAAADPAAAAAPTAAAAAAPSQEPPGSLDVHYQLTERSDRPTLQTKHRVTCGVDVIEHIPDWCTPEEERELMRCVDGADARRWTPLRGRRLQSLGGLPRPPPEMMSREPLPTWVQSVCDALVASGAFPADTPPNHVLLNEYTPGQGIDAHKDGPLYAPHVCILSLNSTATFEFLEEVSPPGDGAPPTAEESSAAMASAPTRTAVARLLLPPRGVLVFSGDAYENKLHRVPPRHEDDPQQVGLIRLDGEGASAAAAAGGEDCLAVGARCLPRSRRVSLTVRHVLRSTPGAELAEEDAGETANTASAVPLHVQRHEIAKLFGPKHSPQASPSAPRRKAPSARGAGAGAAPAQHATAESQSADSDAHQAVRSSTCQLEVGMASLLPSVS